LAADLPGDALARLDGFFAAGRRDATFLPGFFNSRPAIDHESITDSR
jgi:hypothetical protein